MDDRAAQDALRAMENSARLLRLALSDNGYRPMLWKRGSPDHVDDIVARFGVFERMHIEWELNVGPSAAAAAIRAAIARGTVIEIEAAVGNKGAVYRWTGKIN